MPPPTPSAAKLLAEIEAQQPQMLACLRAWVEMETPSREPERVRALAVDVAHAFEAAGCTATMHPSALELRAAGSPDREPILILGHLDTVYPVGTLDQMPFQVDDRQARGPGVFDMKAGLVQALFALQALLRNPPGEDHAPLIFLFAFDEEIGSPASRPITERLARTARAVLVLEPASGEEGKLKIARKGIARYALAAHGIAAHSGLDFDRGASAIVELAAHIGELARWSDPERGVTVNPGLLAGGSGVNVVAAEASGQIEVRAWTAADLDRVDRGVRALRPRDPRVRLEITGEISRPPMEASAAARTLFARVQALAAEVGLTLDATRVGGASDGNFTAALGVPTLDGLGAIGAGAHSAGEHIQLACLIPRTALLVRLFAAL